MMKNANLVIILNKNLRMRLTVSLISVFIFLTFENFYFSKY